LAADQRPVRRFLDLGCGDGILTAAILDRFPEAQGDLVDFSEPMLEAAQQKLANFASNLNFKQLDYADPAWVKLVMGDAPFDAVVSGYSIHHQPDERKRTLFTEIYRLLRPGGWFVNVEHVAPGASLSSTLFYKHIVDTLYTVQQYGGSTKTREQVADEFYRREDRVANILAPVEVQCDWLRQIGYQDVDCYFKIYDLAVFGGRHPDN
jgi:tRNA (cmo5U34)-methyltransferase